MQKDILDLEAEVVYNELCCYCGACGAFCEYITYENERPTTKEKCHEIQGGCYKICPRTSFAPLEMDRMIFGTVRDDNVLGYYREIVGARANDEKIRERGQDGGVVTALLTFAMENGDIDAVVTAREDNWKAEAAVTTKKEDIIANAGSKYTSCPSILGVGEALEEHERIALVGLPCHIQAMRKIKVSNLNLNAERVKICIGLFCTESFYYDKLAEKLLEFDVKMEDVEKFDITKGKFYAFTKKGEVQIPVKEMDSCVRDGCRVCYDFASEHADISAGSAGSAEGWTTLIIRTEEGANLVKAAEEKGIIEKIEIKDEGIDDIRKSASRKKKGNLETIMGISDRVKLANLIVEPEELISVLKS
jgi:coenzyme F420 hydrogenase subunit beta